VVAVIATDLDIQGLEIHEVRITCTAGEWHLYLNGREVVQEPTTDWVVTFTADALSAPEPQRCPKCGSDDPRQDLYLGGPEFNRSYPLTCPDAFHRGES
jgi:hypothetical protein